MLPLPAPEVVVVADYGGQVVDYSARVSAYLKRRVRVRIEGLCASACTLVLQLPPARLCAGPGASFAFHQAYNGNRFDPLDTTIRNPVGTAALMRAYPAKVRAWIGERGGLGPDLITLEGEALRAIVRPCR